MPIPNILDPCIPVRPVVCGGCADDEVDPGCSTSCVGVSLCPPVIVDPPGQRCVNDNVRRPWPSPPPAETGCSPVTVDVSNQPVEPEDEDQSLRLEGTVDYIAGDACLPRLNLTLKTPPWLGGGTSNPLVKTGCGYTSLGRGYRIGDLGTDFDKYATPEAFFAEEFGAESFIPVTPWTEEYDCNQCNGKEAFGSQVSNYSIIGPMLAKVKSSSSIGGVPGPGGVSIITTWEYKVELVGNIRDILRSNLGPIDNATCTTVDKWYEQGEVGHGIVPPGTSPGEMTAFNIKETVLPRTGTATHLPPGTDLVAMYQKGYAPVPVMNDTPILLYGYVPWAKKTTQADCSCKIVWFFDEQLTFQGDCPATGGQQSLMPSRNLLDAGEFYGSSSTEGRV
jgi:hypothetical protein